MPTMSRTFHQWGTTVLLPAAAAVALALTVSLAGQTPSPSRRDPTPDEIKKAEALYRDVYGVEHDKLTASKVKADKVAFAKRLVDAAALAKDDRALARVLTEKALAFAVADPSGYRIALAVRREQAEDPRRRREALREAAVLLESLFKTEKTAADRARTARELIEAYRSSAEEEADAGDAAAAGALLAKARGIARQLPGSSAREALDEIDADERDLQAAGKLAAERRRLEEAVKKDPLDPRLRQALAVLTLRAGRLQEASARLSECREEPLRALGTLLASELGGELELAEAFRAAGWAASPEHRVVLLYRARTHYEAALAEDPMHPDMLRIRLLLELLPTVEELPPLPGLRGPAPGSVVALFDDNRTLIDVINGAKAASAEPLLAETKDVYSGPLALRMQTRGNWLERIPGWNYRIVERPAKPGEFRYLRFAWKFLGGNGTLLIQFADNGNWASTVGKEKVIGYHWSPTATAGLRVADAPPTNWTTVTRDLFKDFGEFPLTGLSLSVQGGKATVLFDQIYLGRTVQDLNRLPLRRR